MVVIYYIEEYQFLQIQDLEFIQKNLIHGTTILQDWYNVTSGNVNYRELFEKYPNSKIEWEYIGECNEFRGKIYSNGDGITHKEEYEMENEEEEEE